VEGEVQRLVFNALSHTYTDHLRQHTPHQTVRVFVREGPRIEFVDVKGLARDLFPGNFYREILAELNSKTGS
jgi:hypothetical protein